MKFTRQKYVRRLLNYYRRNFHVDSPFIILIDGTFAFEALRWKIQIDEQLKAYLETDQIKCSTTLCAIRETELIGTIGHGAMLILKQYDIVRCNHYPSILAEKCFQEILIKNIDKKYFLASQSLALREYSHINRPDLPTMIINHNAINLERPSNISLSIVENEKQKQINLTEYESKQLKQIKHELNLEHEFDKTQKKKKKKKGINPLAMKPKNKKKNLKHDQSSINKKEKRKRRRTRQIRMSFHLKEFLENLKSKFSIREFLHMKT